MNLCCQAGRLRGRDRLGICDWHVHTVIFKIDNQQGPTVKKKKEKDRAEINETETNKTDKPFARLRKKERGLK